MYSHANASKMSDDDYPDIELVLGASSLTGDISGSYRSLLGLTEEFYKKVFGDYKGFDSFMIVPVLLRPKSRGRLTLRNSDPLDSPIVDLNYYGHEDDLNTMVQAIKIVRKKSLRINMCSIFILRFFFIYFIFYVFVLHYRILLLSHIIHLELYSLCNKHLSLFCCFFLYIISNYLSFLYVFYVIMHYNIFLLYLS